MERGIASGRRVGEVILGSTRRVGDTCDDRPSDAEAARFKLDFPTSEGACKVYTCIQYKLQI